MTDPASTSVGLGASGGAAQASLAMEQAQANRASGLQGGSFTEMLNAARAGSEKAEDALDKALKEFESFYVGKMLNVVFEKLPTDGPLGGGHAESVYRSLLVDEYGKLVAGQGGLGLAEQMKAQLLSQQEVGE